MAQNPQVAILCPDCGKLISPQAETCIHCGRKKPGTWNPKSALRNQFNDYGFTEIVTALCVGLYVLGLMLDLLYHSGSTSRAGSFFSILSPSGYSLEVLGMTGAVALSEGRWWTLITAIYLHGGLLHIFFNVMWIRQLAPEVEELFGRARLVLIFTFSGILGFVLSSFRGNLYTVGASGAIFGLLGAMVYYGRTRGGTFGANVYRQTMQWAGILFIFGLFVPNVDNWAHGGGFAGGYIAAMLLGFSEQSKETSQVHALTLSTIVMTVLSFIVVFWRLFF